MLHILRVEEIKRPFDPPQFERKYCFKCRKHREHQWQVHIPQGETGKYYEPYMTIDCEVCKKDYTEFGSA